MALQLQNHHFDPVDTVNILYNTFISGSSIHLGGTGDFPPKNVVLANNIFASDLKLLAEDPTNKEKWYNNIAVEQNDIRIKGVDTSTLTFMKNPHGLFEPQFGSWDHHVYTDHQAYDIPVLDDDPLVQKDIMKQKRAGQLASFPGAYLPGKRISLNYYATSENTGPDYME